MSHVQGAVNGPDLQYFNSQDHAQQSATSSTYPQQDAIQSCPALIVFKEDHNNNIKTYLLFRSAYIGQGSISGV